MTGTSLRLGSLLVFVSIALSGAAIAATTPSSGTISPGGSLSFTGGPFPASNPADQTGMQPPACTNANCGQFAMTVSIPSTDFNSYRARVTVSWTNSGTTTLGSSTSDYDVYVYSPDVSGSQSGKSATSANPEIATFAVTNGTYTIYVVPYDVSPSVAFSGTISLIRVDQTPWPTPSPAPALPPGTPRFFSYHAPAGVAESAGEPSIGVNRKTEQVFSGIPNGGTVNYFGGFLPYMLSVTFDDRTAPATSTWRQVPLLLTTAPRVFGDPYLFTDKDTGRTFVAQEMGLTPLGSTMEYTDNDNSPFLPSTGSGAPSGVDHETVGGGPYHAPIPTGTNPLYPHSVWYCSQSIADAVCSISLDGGVTFGPAVPMFTVKDCSGLHGHIKIGPDGTAYVPDRACGGSLPYHNSGGATPALMVSEDNGATWQIRKLTNATTLTDRDPSVAIDGDNGVYFAYQAGDGHSHIAVSKDKGLSWINDADVGASLHVQNSLFHTAVAGDKGRAAAAFFGTENAGNYAAPDFPGVWYLFISTTFDGGAHWTTQNATPGDPIQRGGICGSGGCRNLLDFFDSTIDKEGRVLVGYDDGCISTNCISGFRSYGLIAANDFTAKAAIARQASGPRMYAAYDSMSGPDVTPPLPPPRPADATSCDGIVATDPAGDADHPLLHSNGGSADQVDITAVAFGLTADKASMVTTITLKNFTPQPISGSLGTYYYTTWTSARKNGDGTVATHTFATRAAVSVTGAVTYTFGQYDQANDAFVGTTTPVTGSFVTGPNGSVSVTVPLSLLGNPTIPVTDSTSFPAVIEPYALTIITEQAVRFVQAADRAPNAGSVGASWQVCLPVVTCVEDDDRTISYSSGWHQFTNSNASGGHFRMHTGTGGSASITVNVTSGRTGKITYYYATSPKGGSAEVFVDGVSRGTVSYQSSTGTTRAPVFGANFVVASLASGAHRFEIKNLSGAVYIDRFCLENANSTGAPTSGPGQTSTSSSTNAVGQESTSQVTIPANATSISVVAEASPEVPVKVVLIDPSGLALATADNSTGFATIDQTVTQGGVYIVKVINLSLGPVDVWTAATPQVSQ